MMKLKIYVGSFLCILISFLLLSNTSNSFAQTKVRVQGVVKSESGEVLPGVSVIVKDTKQGTMTNEKGEYSISVEPGKILVFNYLGFKSYAQGVSKAGTINVTLEETISAMDEIVVVGYGSLKKSAITSAVSKLENKNLDEIPTSRLDNALIGKIAGVTVQNVTSEVGADPVVRVRGFSSISADSSPLVVVDGYPVPDGLSFVNPQDVESIEVLKDAASASIYGSRAANGVILITTKAGTPDKPKFTLKSYYGLRDAVKLHPLMNFTEYVEKLYREGELRQDDPSVPAGQKIRISAQERSAYIIENYIADGPTDWQQVGLRNSAAIYNVQLGVSGGKRDLKYYVSGSMQKDEGIMNYSQNERMTFKTKLDGNFSKKLKFSVNFNPTYIKTDRPAVNFTDYYRWYSYIPVRHTEFTAAYVRQNPQWANILPGDYAQARHFNNLNYGGYMPDGSFWSGAGGNVWSTNNNSPISIADRESRARTAYRILTTGDLSYEIIPKLILKTSLGGYYNYQENTTFTQSSARQDGAVNQALITGSHFKDLLWENTLNYNYSKKNHNFTGLLGYTVQQTWVDESSMAGLDFPTETFQTLNQAAQIDQSRTFTLKDRVGLVSYLGRLTYDYKSKYMLTASFRADGSSYFAKGNKWGFFPSVSAGWNVTSEPFMSSTASWLSNMKIRTSYGATGNNKITSFMYQDLLYPANYGFGAGTGSVNLGLSPNSNVIGNPGITWERTFESNTGLDLGFLQNRFNLSAEYYYSTTDRLLFRQATMSFSGSNEYINNIGKVSNRGIELEFSSNNIKTKNFEWTTALNFSRNKNKLLELGGEPYQYSYGERNEIYAAVVGKPSIQFFGYRNDGVWTSQDQIDEAVANGLTTPLANYLLPGGLRYQDTNNDNIIDVNDRVPLGDPFPDFMWGITNNFKFKGFDLNILLQGSQGGKLVNGDAYYNETKRFNKNFNTENRWLSAGAPGDGKTPYFTTGADWMVSDYVLEDASYISLRNVILGYTIPKKSLKKLGANGLRMYVATDNLFYFMGSSYRGINPEARTTSGDYSSPLISGYQRGAFPLMRTFTFGLDINF